MVHIGGLPFGFFYTKDKNTLVEIDRKEEGESSPLLATFSGVVNLPSEYAKTASGNVVVLLDKEWNVLDVDDIPCDDVFTACGETFISFLRGEDTIVFVVSPSLLEMFAEITAGHEGELSSIEVDSDSFRLNVLTIGNMVNAKDVEGSGKYLVLAAKSGAVSEDKVRRKITVSSASAGLFDVSL